MISWSVDSCKLYQFAEKEKLQFSLYQILPLNEPDVTYAHSVSNSSNAELYKKLIWEGVAVTFMPRLAFQYKFKNDGFVCIPSTDTPPINHALIYHDDPQSVNYQLLQTVLTFIQAHFHRRFGAKASE